MARTALVLQVPSLDECIKSKMVQPRSPNDDQALTSVRRPRSANEQDAIIAVARCMAATQPMRAMMIHS
jgi:hypothetical protein